MASERSSCLFGNASPWVRFFKLEVNDLKYMREVLFVFQLKVLISVFFLQDRTMDSLTIPPNFQSTTKPRATTGNNNGNLKSIRSVVLGKDGVGKSGIWKPNMSNRCMFSFVLSWKLEIKQSLKSNKAWNQTKLYLTAGRRIRNVWTIFFTLKRSSKSRVVAVHISRDAFLCDVWFWDNREWRKKSQ